MKAGSAQGRERAGPAVCLSIQQGEGIHAFLNAKRAAVQRDVIVLNGSLLQIRVKLIISGAALVLILQTRFRRITSFAVLFHDAFCTALHVRMDEDAQAVGLSPKDMFGRRFQTGG